MSQAYYDDSLRLLWSEIKRPQMYEYDVIHGVNCGSDCGCSKILQAGNDIRRRPKKGRKAGGHNRK